MVANWDQGIWLSASRKGMSEATQKVHKSRSVSELHVLLAAAGRALGATDLSRVSEAENMKIKAPKLPLSSVLAGVAAERTGAECDAS